MGVVAEIFCLVVAFFIGIVAGWWLAMRRVDLQVEELSRERDV